MPTTSPQSVVDQLNWRYAIKKFDSSRKIPADVWSKLEQALVLSPSSFGLQPWRFVVVTDAAMKAKLTTVSWNQPQVTDCSHHVVFAARTTVTPDDVERFIKLSAEVRKVPVESLEAYKGMMMGFVKNPAPGFDAFAWAGKQAYIALGHFMASAAMMGVDTCPMEGINAAQYDEFLGLPKEGYRTVVTCAAGYRAADDKYQHLAKIRYPASQIVKNV